MTLAGWILLILSWGLIIALNIFCFVKVLGKKDDNSSAESMGENSTPMSQ